MTARGFIFLNLPKITRIIFFFGKCGPKRRLSDGAFNWFVDFSFWSDDVVEEEVGGRKRSVDKC